MSHDKIDAPPMTARRRHSAPDQGAPDPDAPGTPAARRRAAVAPRITSRDVPPLIPVDGAIGALIMGEAPGPRGADQSGVPFLGDRAGRLVYRALRAAERVTWPDFETTLAWEGKQFLAAARVHPESPTARDGVGARRVSRVPRRDRTREGRGRRFRSGRASGDGGHGVHRPTAPLGAGPAASRTPARQRVVTVQP